MNWFYEWLSGLGYTHPIHPPMTYIPMGMVIGALVFVIWAKLSRRSKYVLTARHCVTLAFVGVFPTILLGYMDWQQYYGGAWLFVIKMKIVLAIVLTVLLLLTVLLHLKFSAGALPLILVYLITFVNIVALGYYGGELVFATPVADQTEHSPSQRNAGGPVTFEQVQAVFEQHCVMCHSGEDPAHDLALTSYEAVMKGGHHGKLIQPGQPAQSELVKRIKGITEPRMPLGQAPLPESKIELIVNWIDAGAPE